MKPIPSLLAFFAAVLAALPSRADVVVSDVDHAQPITRIAFGSCFDPRRGESSIFDGILARKPDVFVFLGDNLYGDTHDMDLLRKKYAELEAIDGFRRLRESTTLLATWDDHDYGTNDGGKSYPMREPSRQIFLDFFKEPPASPRRARLGLHASHRFGPAGKSCQILLLDTRYFRDELPRRAGPPEKGTVGWYEPTADTSKTLLGESQWQWLEQQLRIPADIRIIATSIQMISAEKGMENWGNVPHERQRLFDLLRKHKAHHTFAISGDVHFAELSKYDLGGYPFYDLTSSGMSHVNASWAAAANSFRIGQPQAQLNAGWIEIDWSSNTVDLAVINPQGAEILKHTIQLADLEFR